LECDRFQILALDGGGIKGMFSSAVLSHLENDLKISVADHFDLIVGTSTGGIIALGLGAGLSPRDIVSFYVEHGPSIFAGGVSFLRRCLSPKHNPAPLEDALRKCFGEGLLADSQKRLVIPSYNIGDDDIYLFKTPHHARFNRDYKVPLWQVAISTSAAPTYFPAFKGVDHMRLVDGGVWANNPTMIGIIEAIGILEVPLSSIKVFSLGTTDEVKSHPKNLDQGGLWQWKKAAINVVMRGQSIGATTQALHLLGQDKVLRFDPKVPDNLFALDRLTEDELLSKAAHESRKMTPQFKEVFADHKAAEYKPLIT
jgi:patatin-like phospholipase/acyl hydrolase